MLLHVSGSRLAYAEMQGISDLELGVRPGGFQHASNMIRAQSQQSESSAAIPVHSVQALINPSTPTSRFPVYCIA